MPTASTLHKLAATLIFAGVAAWAVSHLVK